MTDVDAGSYEVVRGRLVEQAKALSAKVDALNAKRRETFGGTELSVLATERIRTENNCVPCDVLGIGPNLLLGYNVFIGLKTETAVSDVFSVHRFVQGESGFDVAQLPAVDTPFLSEPTFVRDFRDLYKYYKDTRLVRLQKTEGALLAVFQTGSSARDVKVFRWRLGRDGVGPYVDNRGDEEIVPPKQHDFEWTVVGRDRLVAGRFPHLSIEDEVFVETLHGDLTIKVENNTDSGVGIYSEPVDDPNQSLDDADVRYARVGGLLLLRIKPYREEAHRYFVFNTRTKRVARIDAVGQACVQLPEGQGVIFPGGYYLQTGDFKRFEGDAADLAFDRAVRSPNGEDVLYVFHRRSDGVYVLLAYNVIRKEVQTPITCHGMSLFDDGKLLVLRVASSEASRVHPVQIWQTPFSSAEHAAERKGEPTFLSKVGNSDLVRGISDCYSVCRLVGEQEPTRRVYEDLVALVARVLDAYYWLGHVDVGDLATTLSAIRATAELIVDEFDKVVAIRKRAAEAVAEAERKQREIVDLLTPDSWGSVEPFLEALTKLRSQRGHLITLRDLRYVDLPKLESLERDNVIAFDQISDACVRFLSGGEALRPLAASLDALSGDIEKLERSVDVQPVAERLETTGSGLTVLAEVVAGLSIGDPALRTTILEGIGEVFGKLNRVRAILQSRRKEIGAKEGRAEFGAQFKLLSQNVSGALALCDTPERCDEQLARAMVQVEEMEGRFGELDEFVGPLTEKREELFEAFGARKQQLLDERQRRAGALASAAERILSGLSRRARTFKSADELHAFYASDAMVLKVRSVAEQLLALGDSVRADELESRVKSSKQEALRALRDQLDLYEEGTDVIKLGRHRFNVNTQPVELTLVPRDGEMAIHVSGTGFYETVTNEAFLRTRAHWDQTVVSENDAVYRGEYLAVSVLAAAEEGRDGLSWSALQQAALARGGTADLVRAFAAARYEEGYERGIHDSDATAILEAVLALRASAGLLRFGARARTLACLYWAFGPDQEARSSLQRRASSLGRLRHAFGESQAAREIVEDVERALVRFVESEGFRGASARSADAASLAGAGMRDPPGAGPGDELGLARHAATYLVEELTTDPPRFATSAAAANLAERLIHRLERDGTRAAFEEDLKALERRLGERRELVRAWTDGFVRVSGLPVDSAVTEEATGILLTERRLDRHATASPNAVEVSGLLGQHRRIVERKMSVRLDELEERLAEFVRTTVPGFRELRKARHELLERERSRLRLEELKPRVLSSFVRNRLIDEVYLPLIGTNLAKQLGAAGEAKRTDLMGLLLLISPPGYGKTTLMEYVASRLGLVFVKVNGPSLGEAVRSFDPEEAPNATARQEVDKINLAFEMGNNVMLYLDDIQHTSAELLQKFISLCDAQRRVEGVWKGRTRTYDLRGKKFCVVMAGNPYTESGARFQIPDMLANRADTYNLGDILEGKDDVFALSYVENAVTSNPVLAPLATRDMADLYKLVRIAKGEEVPTTDLSFGYSAAEIGEIVAVLQRLFKVQSVLLRVNMEYIASASQDDRFRAEPAFKLQGSYRNMNKLAEKIVAAMNDEEIERLIDDHYGQESQTLTTGAEHNLLKLKELRGRLTDGDKARWAEIKKAFAKAKARGGDEADPATRVTGELSSLGEHLEGIRDAVSQAVWHQIEGTKKKKPARSDLFLAPVLQSIPPLLEKIDATLERLAPPMSPPTAPPPGREGGGEGGPRGDEPG